ncbi:hypothetical protein BSKO_13461 [Bryopsis sp. KO-2023]|nr:hypothetical protein BSKO_13461 [Bryopsis sp. KO-2023]
MARENENRGLVYSQGWTENFGRQADVELVVEGETLLAHSQILCQSEVLEGAIRFTKNDGVRIRIESLLTDVSVADVDLLLSQLYASPSRLDPETLPNLRKILDLAMKCGFDGLVTRVLDTLTSSYGRGNESSYLKELREECGRHQVDMIVYWLGICSRTKHEALADALARFMAIYSETFKLDRNWERIREVLKGDADLCCKVLRSFCMREKEFIPKCKDCHKPFESGFSDSVPFHSSALNRESVAVVRSQNRHSQLCSCQKITDEVPFGRTIHYYFEIRASTKP